MTDDAAPVTSTKVMVELKQFEPNGLTFDDIQAIASALGMSLDDFISVAVSEIGVRELMLLSHGNPEGWSEITDRVLPNLDEERPLGRPEGGVN